MEILHHWLWYHDKFLGVDWNFWKCVGYAGTAIFSSRFVVQWYATEKRKQVVVPQAFWWLSLVGTWLLLAYWIHKKDSVGILSYVLAWIPYIRSLVIHRRHKKAHTICVSCAKKIPPQSNYCPNCGGKVE
ncbi:MAG TPA: lipid-A-disaccharide synthase N-terminal domain-containing protein [Verrucomicrobiae bacterium]